ncbi:MAG TPA: hypothetical protein VJN94_09845 [Candidatus Binataceae bacterium]|nr:hypothetical protein [Candidatus Binataceae bacterium]
MLPSGAYRYEIRRGAEIVAIEEANLDGATIMASRRAADGLNHYEAEVTLDPDGRVHRVSIRYSSSLFTRKATYEAAGESFRGSVSALAGRNEIVVGLGRFREVDVAGLTIFRALIIAHVSERGQTRWTGRVAVIDPSSLVAASLKQNCARRDDSGRRWSYEPRMGDAEEIELDEAGRILQRRDNRGLASVLMV